MVYDKMSCVLMSCVDLRASRAKPFKVDSTKPLSSLFSLSDLRIDLVPSKVLGSVLFLRERQRDFDLLLMKST